MACTLTVLYSRGLHSALHYFQLPIQAHSNPVMVVNYYKVATATLTTINSGSKVSFYALIPSVKKVK